MTDTVDSMSDTNNEVKVEIKTLFERERNALNLNVRELGKLADVSYTVIYDLERRNILPKMETLIKLAEALGFTVTVKHSNSEETTALSLIFHKGNIEDKKFLLGNTSKNPKLSIDEQLRKLLTLKGLYADDITEIEKYIAFKLSQH